MQVLRWAKLKLKTGFRFWCFVYFILMKNKNHQNKTNRMCIKHGNLQCFLSMFLNVFNTTVGKWYIPPSSGRPWGGYHIYIYIHRYINICFIYTYHTNYTAETVSPSVAWRWMPRMGLILLVDKFEKACHGHVAGRVVGLLGCRLW